MNKTLSFLFGISLVMSSALLPSAVQAEVLTVGICEDCFATVQTAITAAADGDIVSIEAGTYTEKITIPNGLSVAIQGDQFDNSAVTINGNVEVRGKANLEIESLTLNATGKRWGMKVNRQGYATVRYGVLQKGTDGIMVESGGGVELYGQIVKQARRNGLLVKEDGQATVSNSIVRQNGSSGVRARKATEITVTGSTVSRNKHGVTLKYMDSSNSWITKTTFRRNKHALHLKQSTPYLNDNKYINNTKNVVRN